MFIMWIVDFIKDIFFGWFFWLFEALPIVIWTMIWQGIALWRSARNNQIYWFLFNLILGYGGIVPIIYLLWFQKYKTDYSKNLKDKS